MQAGRSSRLRRPQARRRSRRAPRPLLAALLAALAVCARAAAAHRLLFYPLGERTHMMVHLELASELAARGHDVFFAAPECHVPFARALAAERRPAAADGAAAGGGEITYIPYALDCAFVEEDKKRAAAAGQLHGIWMILKALAARADALLSDGAFMAALRRLRDGPQGGIDLVIADPLAFGALLPAALGLPFIDFDVGTAGSLFEPVFYGAVPAAAYIPAVGTFLPTGGMALHQKAANVAASLGARALLRAVYFHPWMWVQRIIRKHGIPLRWPYTGPLLELVNSNWVTEPPRPVGPMTKYVGPILPRPPRPLPRDLEAWLSAPGAAAGAVLVSFGGTLAAPPPAARAVLLAAAALPGARFVWKLAEAERAAVAADLAAANLTNLWVAPWVPQNDLLGHPSVKAFVTQGGFLSIGEAAYHGVPIVGLPLIAGQGELIRFAADQGRGIMLCKSVLSRGDPTRLAAAVRAVLSDPSYARAAGLAAARLRAVRVPYAVQAADWVEYAAALRDHGSFLATQGQRMAWWRAACLDVAAALLLLAAAALWWLGRAWSARRRGNSGGGGEKEEGEHPVQVQLMVPHSPRGAAAKLPAADAGPLKATPKATTPAAGRGRGGQLASPVAREAAGTAAEGPEAAEPPRQAQLRRRSQAPRSVEAGGAGAAAAAAAAAAPGSRRSGRLQQRHPLKAEWWVVQP
ncbi:MAG: hypothetical protein J3K34DRAFT_516913 [Monoraphidium minutum]|nr:MAG: hypothetical protein J3K34DRAFT_516913 [Monoraphidium minutum]